MPISLGYTIDPVTGRKVKITSVLGNIGWVGTEEGESVYDPESYARITREAEAGQLKEPEVPSEKYYVIGDKGWGVSEDFETFISPKGEKYGLTGMQGKFADIGVSNLVYDYAKALLVPTTAEGVSRREEYYTSLEYDIRLAEEQGRVEDIFRAVLPGATREGIRQMLTDITIRPDMAETDRAFAEQLQSDFLQSIRDIGRSEETELLLQTIFSQITNDDIDLLFGTVPIPSVPTEKETPEAVLQLEPEWQNVRTGEVISGSEKAHRYPKGYEAELDEWVLTRETALNYGSVFKVFGQALTKLPKQWSAAILQAFQGKEGASVVDRDWADRWIEEATTEQEAFATEVAEKYGQTRLPISLVDLAELPKNMAFSLTSMGAGLVVGVPIALAPVPGARIIAWGAGTAASGAVAYNMTTYQIMQQYLEVKNDEMLAKVGRGLTAEEENALKKDFSNQAIRYGLWEAIPEAISNLAFAKLLTMPLGKMVGRNIATKIIGKLFGIYGAELLTETITQKGQSDIEVEAGLRDKRISWIEAFKEVAPQTFLLTTILGGAGQVGISSVRKIKESLKREIGDITIYQAINENITERIFDEVEAEAQANLPTAPEVIIPVVPEKVTPVVEPANAVELRVLHTDLTRVKGLRNSTRVEAMAYLNRLKALARTEGIEADIVKIDQAIREAQEGDLGAAGVLADDVLTHIHKRYKTIHPEFELAIPKAEAEIKVGDVITDGLVNAEVIKVGTFQFGKMKVEGYRARIISPQGRGQETIINKEDARLVPPEAPAVAEVGMPRPRYPATPEGAEARAKAEGISIAEASVLNAEEAIAREELPYLSVPEETTLLMPDDVNVSEDRVVRPPPPPKVPPSLEPPLTHPPQPAPIEAGRLVMPDLQAPQVIVDLYSKPDFWRRVANLPLVKKVIGLFNPAAVANDPARQALILRAVLKDEAAQKAQAVMSHLWEIGTQERVWGKTDDKGLLTKNPWAGLALDDIRTHPDRYLDLMTAQEKEWIKRAEEIEKAKLNALKRNEVEINELSFEDGGVYAGRRVMGKFNDAGELIESGRIRVGGRVGAKEAFEKTRVFLTAQDGVEAGYRYMNSDESLYYNTLGAYYKIADKQMAEWLLTKIDWRTTAAPETLVLQAEASRLRLRKAQQLLAALNRAVRGERVPSNTINSIASVYTDQADTLKNLIPKLQKPAPETADIVRILDSEAKALISEARLEYAQAVDKRARAREEALRVKYEEASIAHPAFQGKIFIGAEAKEIADILRRGLQPQFIEALGAVNKVNAIGRFFMLAGDASPMAIQLQFLAFYRPVVYAKAWGGFVRAFFDPQLQYRYYANNRDLINRHPTLILSGRGTEFTEFMGRGGLGKKLGVLAKPLVPFQKAFESTIDVAGIELAKSLDHLATTPERTLEIDQFINEFRGLTSSARIGISSTQRQVETAIFLAPRYNRAIAGYLFDIVHGGLRGGLARLSLAQGFAGLATMAVAVSIALGEDDDEIWEHFNPQSPKFFTWDVMGVKIGLGGKVRSIIKIFGSMLKDGKVGKHALNFLEANLAPGARTALDLITGKNYIGEPTRDNVLNFSKTILKNFMMIWTQNLLEEGGTLKEKAIIATAEFFGLRGYDISARKELKIRDLVDLLGQQIGKTPVLTKKKPDIYDTGNIYADIKRIVQYISPEEVLADKGYAPWGHLVVRIQQSEANSLPDKRLKDYNFDPAKGDTLDDYSKQWAERQQLIADGKKAKYTRREVIEGKEKLTKFTGAEALEAHIKDYPKAYLGNLTRRQVELMNEYAVAIDKKQFIKEHPEINMNPQVDWFKAHPKENAEFALVGQAKLLSKEASNQFKDMVKELDIPDSALPEMTLPPEKSVENYFKYQDMDNKNSWEAQLLLAQDDGLRVFLERLPIDTPIASLELKVKNRELFDNLDAFSDKDSPEYIADEKVRAEAIKKLKAENPEWVDDMRRIEALEKGTNEAPIDDTLVNAHVEYGKLIDQEGVGSSSAEAMLFRVDNPDYDKFRTDETIWGDQALKAIEVDKIPIWRIDVKYAKEDAEYEALPAGDTRIDYLTRHDDYRQDRRRREAYQKGLATGLIEPYVSYYELPTTGYRRDRFLLNNPEFARAVGLKVPEKVPSEQYDILLEKKNKTPEDLLRMDAYLKYIPDAQVEDYAGYYTIINKGKPKGQDLWFEDDWFLIEHMELYKTMVTMKLWQKKDFSKVPSREVFDLYLQYQKIIISAERLAFRQEHSDLDEWGQIYFGWKPAEGRIIGQTSPWLLSLAEEMADLEERIAALRGKPK